MSVFLLAHLRQPHQKDKVVYPQLAWILVAAHDCGEVDGGHQTLA